MKNFFENLNNRPAHEKRRFSMQATTGVMVAVFLVWVSTLGVRLASTLQDGSIAQTDTGGLVAGVAAAGQDLQTQYGQIQAPQSTQNGSADQTTQVRAAPAIMLQSGVMASTTSGSAPVSEDYSSSN